MDQGQIKHLFDQQAATYDKKWANNSAINDALHFFLDTIFTDLPAQARILCVGVGTGKELLYLAKHFPDWHFTAVDPSGPMLDVCRAQVEKQGFTARCYFHEGYLDSLPKQAPYDAASCFLVSHFMLDAVARTAFFQQIASALKPAGILVSSDLSTDTNALTYDKLLNFWLRMMANSAVSADDISKIKMAYAKDVAILPPNNVAAIIESAGFATPVTFFQAGMIQAFFTQRDRSLEVLAGLTRYPS